MDLKNKLGYAIQHVCSIAKHDDAPIEVRQAALDKLSQHIAAERAGATARAQAKLDAQLQTLSAD